MKKLTVSFKVFLLCFLLFLFLWQSLISVEKFLTLSHTGGIFPSTARGGVNLTRTYLTAAEGTIRHILCNIIEGTFKGGHQ